MTITAAKLAVEIGADTRNVEDGMRRVSRSLDRFASDGDQHLGRVGGSWRRMRGVADDEMDGISRHSSGMLGGMSSGFAAFAGGAAVAGVGVALAGIGTALINLGELAAGVTLDFAQSAMDWEAQFTAVKKTVSGTPAELDTLEQSLRALARRMPVSHEDLAQIAETAGQLGVPTKDIANFTEQIAMLATATDMTAEQAATALGRFSNIMGTPLSSVGSLGAALVALGNDGASTESEIMDMGLRLAAAGKQVGMNEGQVLGLASALSSVGIEAEAGGTAFSRVLVGMNQAVLQGGKKLDTFARVSGISADEFARRWKADPTVALDGFLKGLKRIQDQGGDVDQVLADLDFNDVRVTDALKRASSAGDIFSDSIRLGQQAMLDGTAARDEYAKFADTTASKVEILKNQWNDFKISLGEQLLDWAAPYIESFMKIATTIGDAVAAGGNFNDILGAISAEHGSAVAAAFERIIGVVQIAGAYFWGFLGIVRATMGAAIYPIALLGEAFGHIMSTMMDGFVAFAGFVADVLDAAGFDGMADSLRAAADQMGGFADNFADATTWARQFAGEQVSGGFDMIRQAVNLGADGIAHYNGETTRLQTPVAELGRRVSNLAGEIFKVPTERTTNIWANVQSAWDGIQAVRNAVLGIPDRVVNVYVRAVNQVGNSISDAVAGAIGRRASGGPVQAGGFYLVGEQGPELVTFGVNGYVTPAGPTRQALTGSGGPGPAVAAAGPTTVVLNVDGRRLAEATVQSLNRYGGESTATIGLN